MLSISVRELSRRLVVLDDGAGWRLEPSIYAIFFSHVYVLFGLDLRTMHCVLCLLSETLIAPWGSILYAPKKSETIPRGIKVLVEIGGVRCRSPRPTTDQVFDKSGMEGAIIIYDWTPLRKSHQLIALSPFPLRFGLGDFSLDSGSEQRIFSKEL